MKLSYRNQHNAEAIAAYWKKPLSKSDWFSIQAATATAPAEVFIYDVVGWPYNDAGELVRTLAGMKDDPILARINSPGGDVWDGMSILNAFANHPGGVTVRIESLAASIASVIAMGGRKVEAYQNTMMMIHDSWIIAAGNRIELLEIADILEKVDGNILNAYTGKTKIGKREMRDMMHAETWMNAKEMKEKGFIDTIIESGKAAKAQFDLSMYAQAPEGIGSEREYTDRDRERLIRDVFSLSQSDAKVVLSEMKALITRRKKGGEGDQRDVESLKITEIANQVNKNIATLEEMK